MDYTAIIRESFETCSTVQNHLELEAMAKIVHKLRPKTVVELGVFRGGTVFVWTKVAHEAARIVGVDVPGEPCSVWKNMDSWCSAKQNSLLLEGDTKNPKMLQAAMAFLKDPIDFLYLDASHCYGDVVAEFYLWSPKVRKGGIIGIHDILPRSNTEMGAWKLWKEVKNKYRHREISGKVKPYGTGVLFI